MTTAFITFIAVVCGYVFEALPASYYNEFDRRLIALIRKSLHWPPEPQEWGVGIDAKCIDMKSKTLERFILALSDQPSVTGLDVLVTGLVKSCTISYWEFRIVVLFAKGMSPPRISIDSAGLPGAALPLNADLS
jgi:hypothetical protein